MILATLDIVDNVTPALSGVRNALDETSDTLRDFAQTAPTATNALASHGNLISEVAQRVGQLNQAYTLQAASLGSMYTSMIPGQRITKQYADSVQQVVTQMNALGQIAPSAQRSTAQLLNTFRTGATYTNEMQQSLRGLWQTAEGATSQLVQNANTASQGFLRMFQTITPGMQVTKQFAQEFKNAGSALQATGAISTNAQRSLASLLGTMQPGAVMTQRMAAQFSVVNKEAQALGQLLPSVATGTQQTQVSVLALTAALTAVTAGLSMYLNYATEIAARNQVLATVMGIVANNTNNSELQMRGQVEVAKALGITTQVATGALTDFAQANLDVAKAAQLARVAQDLAVVAGKNSSQTMAQLTQVIQTQRIQVLRQYGIVTNLSLVYKDYAREVGKTTRELTAFDRQQAILNLILTEGDKVAGAYTASMNNVGKAQTSLARYSEELADKIGTQLLPAKLLLVNAQTALYKSALALPDAFIAIATSLGVATAAVTAIGAAISGSRLIGLTALLAPIKTMLVGVAAAFTGAGGAATGFAAAGTAVAGAMGPVGWILAAIIVSLAAMAGAFVYLTAKQEAWVNSGKEVVDTLLKSETELSNNLERARELGNTQNRSVAQNHALKEAIDKVNVAIGNGNFRIDEHTGKLIEDTAQLKLNTAEIERNTLAQIQANRQEYLTLQSELKELEARRGREKDQGADRDRTRRTYAGVGAMTTQYSSGIDRQLQEREDFVKRRIAALEQQNADLAATGTLAGAQAESLRVDKQSVDALVKSSEVTGDTIDKILSRVENNDRQGRRLVAKYRELKKNIGDAQDFRSVPKGSELSQVLSQIASENTSILDRQADELEKSGKKYQNALKNMREQIAGDTVQMRAQATAFEEELNRIARIGSDAEAGAEFERFVDRWGPAVQKLGISITDLAERFPQLSKVVADLSAHKLEGWVERVQVQIDDAIEATLEAVNEIEKRSIEGTSALIKSGHDRLREETRQVNDAIFEMDRDLYEQREVARMSDVDKAIYAEKRRIEDIERTYAREEELRAEARVEENRAFDENIRQSRQALEETIRNVKMQMDIRITNALLERALSKEATFAEVVEYAARLGNLRNYLNDRLDEIKRNSDQQILLDAAASRQILNNQQQQQDALHGRYRAALDRQRQASAENVQRIIADYKIVAQASLALFTGMAQGAANAFAGILTQTQSFKEAFLGIWNSIQRSLMNLWQGMVDQWIKHATNMATANGGFSVGNFARGLFGGSASVGAGAYGTVGAGFAAGTSRNSIPGMDGVAAAGAGLGKGAYAGSTGFASSGMGAAMGGGAVGGVVGGLVASRYADGSYAKGALSGAASGAAAGGAVGGWIGAGVGAIAGGISGWFQARKQRKQMEEDRKTVIEAAGGLEQLRLKAEEAGVSLDKMLKTKSVKEFAAELKKIDAAFVNLERQQLITAAGGEEAMREAIAQTEVLDKVTADAFLNGTLSAERMRDVIQKVAKALELKEAKDGLARTVSAMDNLRKVAVLAGYDLKKLYDAKTIEEFNAQQKAFNKLLEEQQLRLDGLGRAAAGLQMRVTGAMQEYTRDLKGVIEGMNADQKAAWGELVGKDEERRELWKDLADAMGKAGDPEALVKLLQDQMAGSQGIGARLRAVGLDEEQGAKLAQIMANVKTNIDNVASAAASTFGGILRETGSLAAAMNAVAEPLDMINTLLRETGMEAPESLRVLLALRQTMLDNEDVVNSLGGIAEMIKGLGDAGRLSADQYNKFGADAARQWDLMASRGVAADQALLIMQPTLQALYEAQKNFGIATDETTQRLIDMGVEHGLVGDQFQDINSKMLDMLVIIAETLGATIPEAYRRQSAAATTAAQEQAAAQQEAAATTQQAAEETGAAMEALANTDMSALTTQLEKAAVTTADVTSHLKKTDEELAAMLGISLEEFLAGIADMEKRFGEEGINGAVSSTKDRVKELDDEKLELLRQQLEGAETGAYRIVSGADAAKQAIIDLNNDTRDALHELEDNINAISLGRSPGGLKEIRIKSEEAQDAIRSLGKDVIREAMRMERAVNDYVDASEPPDTTNPFDKAPEPSDEFESRYRAKETPREPEQTFNVSMPPVSVQINSLDPSKAAEVFNVQIRPQLERSMKRNTRQLATRVARATRNARPQRIPQ